MDLDVVCEVQILGDFVIEIPGAAEPVIAFPRLFGHVQKSSRNQIITVDATDYYKLIWKLSRYPSARDRT
jgi:hypothetical protein